LPTLAPTPASATEPWPTLAPAPTPTPPTLAPTPTSNAKADVAMNTVATEAAVPLKNILVMVTLLFDEERREQSPHFMHDRSEVVHVRVASLESLARKQTVDRIRLCICATGGCAQIFLPDTGNLFGRNGFQFYFGTYNTIANRYIFYTVKPKAYI
jgi:hypothetical protein